LKLLLILKAQYKETQRISVTSHRHVGERRTAMGRKNVVRGRNAIFDEMAVQQE
jgi:hypothetical protein